MLGSSQAWVSVILLLMLFGLESSRANEEVQVIGTNSTDDQLFSDDESISQGSGKLKIGFSLPIKKMVLVTKQIDLSSLRQVPRLQSNISHNLHNYCLKALNIRSQQRSKVVGGRGQRFKLMTGVPISQAENRAICERNQATMVRPHNETIRAELRQFMQENKVLRVHIDHYYDENAERTLESATGWAIEEVYGDISFFQCLQEETQRQQILTGTRNGSMNITQGKCVKRQDVAW